MTELFAANLQIIQSRWPLAGAILKQQAPGSLDAALVTGQNQTISVDGIQLSSRHNRLAEAKLYIDTLPAGATEVSLYGVGMGDVPSVLLDNPAITKLTVNVLNPAIFALILSYTDQSEWLSHPAVTLELQPGQIKVTQPYIALIADLELCSDENARLRDLLVLEQNLPYINRRHQATDPAIIKRLHDNRPFLLHDPDVIELKRQVHSHKALVIGAGPSLEEHYDYLAKLQTQRQRPLIICADTAMKGLLHHNIRPDIVVCIDGLIGEYHLPLALSKGIALAYYPRVAPEILNGWRGPRFNAYGNSPLYDALGKEIPKTRLYTNGSVIHPAIDLAVLLGGREISLLGCDFCYCHNKSHAFWDDFAKTSQDEMTQTWVKCTTQKVQNASHWVLDGHGQRVATDLNLRAYLRNLETYIAKRPHVRFYQTSLSGARIKGCQYKELKP
ncbi:hypothetical protein AYI82_05870 [Shewanella algae]|uniref:motility associated factor glycosyltransferase family protein n=1 Tax=Shewanella algae TaxID=38313 RepID=UPI001182A60C|nr:6-hydroxymethylpterin diphosphokinase MptE-like protein [Shewanella algae]TVL10547.1 hypothetical protein AYI82_05870 [Shewanella algae]